MWRLDPTFGAVWPVEDGAPEPLNPAAVYTTDAAGLPVKCLDRKSLRRNSLTGLAKIQFKSGLVLAEIAVHVAGSRIWASPPSRPWIKDGQVVADENGKLKYQPVIEFATHSVRSAWSKRVIKAIRAAFPDALPEPTEAGIEADQDGIGRGFWRDGKP